MKNIAYLSAIIIVSVLAIGLGVWAYSGMAPAQVCEDGATCNFQEAQGEGSLGAVVGPDFYGDFRVHGQLGYRAKYREIEQTFSTGTSTITLTADESGSTILLTGSSTKIVLPDDAFTGATFTFMINGAVAGGGSIDGNYIIETAGSNNIYGVLLTGGVDYACSGEDRINFITDGELPGDFVELMSDGTNWLIKANGATTDAKITCTT